MVVIVSTQGRRVAAVLMGGTVASVGLAVAWRRLVGLPSFFAGILSLAIAALMVAYVVAVVLEGSIDRGRRKALSVKVEHSDVTVTSARSHNSVFSDSENRSTTSPPNKTTTTLVEGDTTTT